MAGWTGGYDTPEQIAGFQDWYKKQQGGNRPEDMARFGWTGNEEGAGRASGETYKRWDPYLVKEGQYAGKYKSSRGAGGYYDKPTECPPGMHPGGGDETSPCVPNAGGAGGGAGAGGGGGKGGGKGGKGGKDDLALYQLKDVYSQALSDPTGNKAWQLFAGQGGASSFQGTIDAARARIAGMPVGPARDAAEKQLADMQTRMQLQMPQQATQLALSGLGGVVQPEIGYVTSERDRALQRALGFGNLDLQRELGLGSLGIQQGQLGLAQAGQQFEQGTGFNEMVRQFNANQDLQKWLAEQQGKQATKSGFFGTLGSALGGLLGNAKLFSDIRVKENIAPGRRGLSDLVRLKTYRYTYKFDPDKTPQHGVMAQDLEKVAPELVGEFGGIKTVDAYGLLSMSIEAIKELAKKLEKS